MKTELRLTVIILLLAVANLTAATHYVSLGSTAPTQPYATWATASTTIQQALDVAAAGDQIVVTNGTYATGSRAGNRGVYRVAVDKPLTLQSVNGPQATVIDGGSAVGCVYLTNGANLFGFTLTNGVAVNGGGVYCESTSGVLSNCVLTGNGANGYDGMGGGAFCGTLNNCTLVGNRSASDGGGVSGSILNNCTLTSNSAAFYGGGAQGATLNNCTLTGNSAKQGGGTFFGTLKNCTLTGNWAGFGGGAFCATLDNCTLTGNSAAENGGGAGGGCTLHNCIVFFNSSTISANYSPYGDSMLDYCCTTPLATNGVGNITNAPLFADYTNRNLRLQCNSPCINAGNNAYVTTITDLDGRPRIVGGTVDIGAYEFQPGVSGAFIGWLQRYGLPTDGSTDYDDPDHDGLNNWQEWVCGTCPTNPQSVLRVVSALPSSPNATVTWQSATGVNYFLQRGTKLGSPFVFVATNIIGQAGTTSYADTNATGTGPFFYRVGVGD